MCRIAFRSHHDTDCRLIAPLYPILETGNRVKVPPVGHSGEDIVNIAPQPRKHHFRFRIAETCIEFYHLDTVAAFHQPAVKHALERPALGNHGFRNRFHYRMQGKIPVRLSHERKPRIGAHSSRIGTFIPIVSAFVIL